MRYETNVTTGETITCPDSPTMSVVLPTTQELLSKLDVDNSLTQRNLRNTIMLMNEAFKQITNGALDLSAIPGVAKVYEVEAQAESLRSQL